ncbi:aldo/keto reductase [Salipiger mangrovisoli]|uniref:Aldo/keto reductase n=1 Tax=Salipiger mangrovisoli TaxID=2865933 RepID=A0ABR9X3Z0_9RHOB|nr:aldo/keto reductase [Salipiger mangrovisoli]MBE9638308.1 aldo/keto reductase [Salipiger mangrovisoli]
MKTRQIGKTGVEVTEVSFGCASIGNLYRKVSDAEAEAVLQTAWDAGIRYFDTAPHYGRGLSETRLGRFLKGRDRDSYALSSKLGRVLSPAPEPIAEADSYIEPLPNLMRYDYSGDGIRESFEQACGRLGVTRLDIAYVHDIGAYTHGEDTNARHMEAFFGSGYEALVTLKEAGKIGAFGLGVNECQVCLDVMDHGPIDAILLAGRLTLLDRSAEEALVPRCREAGTSLVLGGVFNSGILATGPVEGATYDYGPAPKEVLDRVAALQAEAESHGIPLATAALHFALRHPATASVLLGTAKASSLTRNLDAIQRDLPAGAEALFV